MALFPGDGALAAEAIAELCYTNPFTARRPELELQALGPAYIEARAGWSRSSLHFQNPNVPALRARTRELLGVAHRTLEAGHTPDAAERRSYAGLVRYHLFDCFDDELTQLIDAVLADQAAGAEPGAFYGEYRAEAQRCYGVGEHFPEPLSKVPHLFATSVQVRLAFTIIFDSLLGTSPAAASLRAAIWESIFTHDMRHYDSALYARMHEIPTLVLGPSGTGKELVARAIGLSGYVPFDGVRERFEAPPASDFRALNLTAMSRTLIESELFGHRRGAFTGAARDRAGFFELCTPHGVVFLDEIGELDPEIQVKLLRVLQSRRFERVGDAKQRAFRGRVLAATHRDLDAQLASGRLRGDLFYRLRADTLRTPALAEQLAEAPGDLRPFVEIGLERVLGDSALVETERAQTLVDDIVAFIHRHGPDYPWPGNFRELEQCVRAFIVHRDYAPLRAERPALPDPPVDMRAALAQLDLTASALLDLYCAAQHDRLGTVTAVARKLELNRRTVRERIAASNGQKLE